MILLPLFPLIHLLRFFHIDSNTDAQTLPSLDATDLHVDLISMMPFLVVLDVLPRYVNPQLVSKI